MERGIDLDLLKDLLKYISSKGPYVGEVFAIWGEDFSVVFVVMMAWSILKGPMVGELG